MVFTHGWHRVKATNNWLYKNCIYSWQFVAHTELNPYENTDTELINHKDDVQEHRETVEAISPCRTKVTLPQQSTAARVKENGELNIPTFQPTTS